MAEEMNETVRIAFCTAPNKEEAETIARHLVEKRLAACCSIIPKIVSIYRWQGKIEKDEEWMLVIKTSARKYDKLEKEIKMQHSYTVPEILSFNIDKGSGAYVDWLLEMIRE